MGNLCSKSGDDPRKDNFAGPGRVLGSAPPRPENARATIPPQQPSYGTTGQTLGGGRGEGTNDAKAAAARAAEERLNKPRAGTGSTAAGGKLLAQLDTQKKQTMNNVLQQSAAENQAHRDADAAVEARQWS